MSERRVFSPYGLNGGCPGKKGKNYLYRRDQETGNVRKMNFGGILLVITKGKNSTTCYPGDRIRIETPGGGGWGKKD